MSITVFFCSLAVLMWRMARRRAVVLWTPRPLQVLVWSFTQTFLATTSDESPSSTARTVTMTSHQSLCREILRSPQNCEYHCLVNPSKHNVLTFCWCFIFCVFYLLNNLKLSMQVVTGLPAW